MKNLSDDAMMRVIINACDSLNITRVHQLGGATSTIASEVGLLEIGRAVERALFAGQPRTETHKEGHGLNDAQLEPLAYIAYLEACDRFGVKPSASDAFHWAWENRTRAAIAQERKA